MYQGVSAAADHGKYIELIAVPEGLTSGFFRVINK